jgi:hypothetical protein
MLVKKWKRRENKDATIYVQFKTLEVTQMKYLGIILDQKSKFQDDNSWCKCVQNTT